MSDFPIETKALTKTYRGQEALRSLDLCLPPGQVVGLAGHNGCGKSTLIRLLVGLETPTSGQALICGRPYRQLEYPLRHVGTMLGGSAATRSRSVRQHLTWIAATHRFPRQRIDEVLHLVGLEQFATRKAGKLSLGMNQRLGLATALLGDPPLLILDEPWNGLDPQSSQLLVDFIKTWRQEGRTVLISSHLLDYLTETCDRLLVLEQGQLVYDGTPTAARTSFAATPWSPTFPTTRTGGEGQENLGGRNA